MNKKTHTRERSSAAEGDRRPAALLVAASALYAIARFASWAGRVKPSDTPAEDSALAADRPAAGPRETAQMPAASSEPTPAEARRSAKARRFSRRRLGSSLVFATLFFAGAALSAVAGDTVGSLTGSGQVTGAACGEPAAAPAEEDDETADPVEACETDETGTDEGASEGESETAPSPLEEAPPAESASGTPVPPSGDEPEPAEGDEPADAPGGGDAPDAPPAPGPDAPGGKGGADGTTRRADPPLVDVRRPPAPRALDPEADADAAVVWLHRVLPDPTPLARRLAPAFARNLRTVSARQRLPWSLVLAVVRAHGHTGRVPVGPRTLAGIAAELAAQRDAIGAYRPWHIALRYSGRTAFADRTVALARYNRAAGLRSLVVGLAAAKPALAARVLADRAIEIYPGGRADIASRRTDVRVLVLLRYLRIAHGSVSVSSLTSGHRVYSRPGVVSAHTYGLAVDIAALGGRPIAGNQEPNGVTERAVRNILLLPAELAPQQVISLLGLGGASFPLADHGDHIHVGY